MARSKQADEAAAAVGTLKILAACRTKEIDPALVSRVQFEADDIVLTVRGEGKATIEVRVERSALPAEIESLPDDPFFPTTTQAQPAPGKVRVQKRKSKRRKGKPQTDIRPPY